MGTPSEKSADAAHRADQDAPASLRLLIVSDCSERMKQLKAALYVSEIEITSVNSLDQLRNFKGRDFDLVVVDVGLEHLAGVLIDLRAKVEYAEISVLVECSRISTEIGFDGVLPRYRAMPCYQSDLVTLVNRRIAFESGARKNRGIL